MRKRQVDDVCSKEPTCLTSPWAIACGKLWTQTAPIDCRLIYASSCFMQVLRPPSSKPGGVTSRDHDAIMTVAGHAMWGSVLISTNWTCSARSLSFHPMALSS
jgi:hypothetical protein